MPLDGDELIEILTDALWRHLDLRPRRRSRDDVRAWARTLVEHLELCGITFQRGSVPPLHGTSSHK